MGDDKSNDQKIDITSPFFLGSHDRPGDTITHVQLRGDNYEEWSRAFRLSLRSRRKHGFIDGTIEKPTDKIKLEDLITVHSMLDSWILRTIAPAVLSTISYYEDTKKLWDDLKERFLVVNGPKIQQLKMEIADCKQTKGMHVVTYYCKLKTLWDDLGTHDLIPGCECGGCKCNIGTKLEKRHDEEQLHQFLIGLDKSKYGSIRSSLLSQESLPSLNRAYQSVTQEERLQEIPQL